MGRDFLRLDGSAPSGRGPKMFVSLRRFMEIWNRAVSVDEVSRITRYTRKSCISMASELRYIGHKLQYFNRRLYD